MRRKSIRHLCFISAILYLTACGSPPPAQVTGQWLGEIEPSGTPLSLELTQEETSVTGSAELGPLEFTVSGEVDGPTLTLNYTERGESINMGGRVAGGTFAGTITTSSSGEVTSSGTFSLERQAPTVEE